ncbi:MAG: MFS transporter [Paenibacillaceae bacterium ZCTH02-B3]|nr:MAG: MFS transporter [Paenibacillaceae bacterium ZCTH02-B3]
MTREKPHQVAVLRGLQFTGNAMFSLLVVCMPLYFAELGFSRLEIGSVYAMGPLMATVSNLLLGLVADKAKSIRLLLGILFLCQIAVFLALAPLRQFAAIAALMGAFYFFQAPAPPMVDSLSLLASDRLGRSFASIRVFASIGFALCAVLYGYLYAEFGSPVVVPAGCLTAAAALAFVPFLGNFQANLRRFDFSELWGILKQRKTVLFFVLVWLVSVPHRVNESFLSLRMQEIGGQGLVGWLWLIASASEIPVMLLLARFGHRLKELPLLSAAAFFYMVRMLLTSVSDSPWAILAISLLHSVTFGIFYVTSMRFMTHLLPDQFRATGQALFVTVWVGLGGLFTGPMAGWLYDTFGAAAPFLLGAGTSLTAAIGFLYAHVRGYS